ncbi:MAG: hypothetical protein F4Y03_10165 [Alphaproteobacteria bacterium]|nr:hypothetical protein [Alphaproteobacteria bacterium]
MNDQDIVEIRLANVAAVWRQAKPWIFLPQPRLSDGLHRAHECNPAWLALKRYGWLQKPFFNASMKYPHLERGVWRNLVFGRGGWVAEADFRAGVECGACS